MTQYQVVTGTETVLRDGTIKLHGPEDFEGMRKAGRLAADAVDTVEVLDLPGQGNDHTPKESVTMQAYADKVVAQLKTHDEPAILVGHSMGGASLLMAAVREPHLFRALFVFEPIVFPPAPEDGVERPPSPLAGGARKRRDRFPSFEAALENSSYVLCAIFEKRIVGLVRCISDDQTICYVQDLLVNPKGQRRGIGTALLSAVLNRYSHVRQLVLMTDNNQSSTEFYKSLGFREISGDLAGFVRLNND